MFVGTSAYFNSIVEAYVLSKVTWQLEVNFTLEKQLLDDDHDGMKNTNLKMNSIPKNARALVLKIYLQCIMHILI